MSNESPPHSKQLVSPLDPAIVRVLQILDPITHDAGCEYFVAGATARDLVMVHVHGLRPGRATYDIDFGIAVENWDHFARLKGTSLQREILRQTGERSSDSSTPIRVRAFRCP